MGMSLVYRLGWLSFRALFRVCFRWRIYGVDQVPETGPAILASNHASFLDPPLIGSSAHREIHYLARESLFRYPGIATLLRSWNAVPVDREGGGATGLLMIINRLEAGGAIILFPEGTRTRDGRLQRARLGVSLIVVKSEAPVIPVRVFGTFEAFGRHAWFPRPRPVTIKYGPPMFFRELRAEARQCSKPRLKEIYRQIADEIMEAIGSLEVARDPGRETETADNRPTDG
jgi:1-acyl-sn-glycerol-3-phosphate acyltransferase